MDSKANPLHFPASRRFRSRRGSTLLLALVAVGALMMIGAHVMQVSSSRIATVA